MKHIIDHFATGVHTKSVNFDRNPSISVKFGILWRKIAKPIIKDKRISVKKFLKNVS